VRGDIEKDGRYKCGQYRRGDWDYIRVLLSGAMWSVGTGDVVELGQAPLEAARSRLCQGGMCKGLSGVQLRAGWECDGLG